MMIFLRKVQWKLCSLWPRANKRVSTYDLKRFDRYLAEVASDGIKELARVEPNEYRKKALESLSSDMERHARGELDYYQWHLAKEAMMSAWNEHLVSEPKR